MVRAEKPMVLTAGKFFMLSLSTFTNVSSSKYIINFTYIVFLILLLFLKYLTILFLQILKTSMAYLSILRNFM